MKSELLMEQVDQALHGMVDDTHRMKLMKWLVDSGFFTAPASTKYHGAYGGGLAQHSLAVTTLLIELTNKLDLQWENKRSPVIVGLFHDVCKMDEYYSTLEEITPPIVDGVMPLTLDTQKVWKEVPKEKQPYLGHGDKSVLLLSSHIQLTNEEVACIRYHRGAYETETWNNMKLAIQRYPNVWWTHTADMLESTLEITHKS